MSLVEPYSFSQRAQQAWDIYDLAGRSKSAFNPQKRVRAFSFGGPSMPDRASSAPPFEAPFAQLGAFAPAQEIVPSFKPLPLQPTFSFGGPQAQGFQPNAGFSQAQEFQQAQQVFQAPQAVSFNWPKPDDSERYFRPAIQVSSITELWSTNPVLSVPVLARRVSRESSNNSYLSKDAKRKIEVFFKFRKTAGANLEERSMTLNKFLSKKFSPQFRDKVVAIEFVGVNLNANNSRYVASNFEKVRKLTFTSCDFIEDSFRHFSTLQKIIRLNMVNCRVRKSHFTGFSNMSDLNRLRFFHCTFARDIEKSHVDSLFASNRLQEFEAFNCHFERNEISTVIKFKGSQQTEINIS